MVTEGVDDADTAFMVKVSVCFPAVNTLVLANEFAKRKSGNKYREELGKL